MKYQTYYKEYFILKSNSLSAVYLIIVYAICSVFLDTLLWISNNTDDFFSLGKYTFGIVSFRCCYYRSDIFRFIDRKIIVASRMLRANVRLISFETEWQVVSCSSSTCSRVFPHLATTRRFQNLNANLIYCRCCARGRRGSISDED